jgi:hypothetical protein
MMAKATRALCHCTLAPNRCRTAATSQSQAAALLRPANFYNSGSTGVKKRQSAIA